MSGQRTAIVALTTAANEEEARRTADTLVEEGLAACVSQTPIRSTYRWQGAVEHASESLLLIKTTADLRDRLEHRIHELSSYEVPEFIVLETCVVGEDYLNWMLSCCPPRS